MCYQSVIFSFLFKLVHADWTKITPNKGASFIFVHITVRIVKGIDFLVAPKKCLFYLFIIIIIVIVIISKRKKKGDV